MAKKATPHNTGLEVTREGCKFKCTWKIKAKEVKLQKIRYRTHDGTSWGDWTTKKLAEKANSFNFELDNTGSITQIQIQTQVQRKKTSSTTFKASDWDASSYVYVVEAPPDPELTVTNDSANRTTFSWSINASDSDAKWYYQCLYRTKNSATPDDSAGWTDWAPADSSSYPYTDNELNTTRIFQIKAVGPGGESNVQTERHVICTSPTATWSDTPVTQSEQNGYYEMTYDVSLDASSYTADTITPQYYIGPPAADMSCPSGASWKDGTAYNYKDGETSYALAVTTDDTVGEDECMWSRVKTTHDGIDSASSPVRVITGRLKAPSVDISMSTPAHSGFVVSVTVDDAGTEVPGTFMQVFLEKSSATGLENYILIGTIPHGASSATITSGLDITDETGYAIHIRNVTADGISMTSEYDSYQTSMPTAPVLNRVSSTTTSGKVYLEWAGSWADATGAIIAWTDDPDNWMSNEEPETYEISEIASAWFITGLETGKKWYFRVRSVQTLDDDNVTYSPWSNEVSIDLSAAPAIPVLYLSPEVITEEGMTTAYWSYVTTDGTSQVAGNIVQATYNGSSWSYGQPIASVTDAQHVDIYAADQGWENGDTVYLALQTRSGSGGVSEYSTPVRLAVAAKPTVQVTSDSFAATETLTEYFAGDGSTAAFTCNHNLSTSPAVTVDGEAAAVASYSGDTVTLAVAPADGAEIAITYTTADNDILNTMPMNIGIATTSAATVTVAIERATNYPMLRPDGTRTDGAMGETVYVKTVPAASSMQHVIALKDLIGRLDDGASYNLVVTAEDVYGQTAEAGAIPFKVHWAHQAWEPSALFWTDYEEYAAKITPVAAAGYAPGDTCDIYRLGADQPELIVSGGQFGETYVDPYPTFGEFSGYKVVTVTPTGDYITEDNGFAEYDSTEHVAYPQMDPQMLVIDFDESRVELPYNIKESNTWKKDFQRTVYLGGHVTGDHNKAVTRDMTAGTVLVRGDDEAIAVQMRELASYAGVCHVRTPEGSSFVADVQVSEDRGYDTKKIDYSLTIQRIDPIGFDGMTEAEWRERR